MNKDMQKGQRRKPHVTRGESFFSVLLVATVLLNILISVSSCIHEDMVDCPQGIDVHFYSKTPCGSDTVYPQLSELKLCVFDRNGLLVSYYGIDQIELQSYSVEVLDAGNRLFSVVAWSGLDSGVFDLNELKAGGTTKSDLLFRLQRIASLQAASLEERQVYFGESPIVFLPDPAEYGSVFESTSINLQEITNRLTIQVEGLPRSDDYEVVIESANGSMNIDGSVASDQIIRYASMSGFTDNGILEAKFTILKLITGYNSTLIVKDKKLNRELYRGDLLGTLLLKSPEVNLECDHDFNIRFTTADQCECGTYMIMKIWVNNWLVHSFNTDL